MKESGNEVNGEEINVAILASLQQTQDQEAEMLLRDLHEKVSNLRRLFVCTNQN